MRDFQIVRYCGDENTIWGILMLWILGWFDLFRGLIRVISLGTLDTDAKLWFVLRSNGNSFKRYEYTQRKDVSVL